MMLWYNQTVGGPWTKMTLTTLVQMYLNCCTSLTCLINVFDVDLMLTVLSFFFSSSGFFIVCLVNVDLPRASVFSQPAASTGNTPRHVWLYLNTHSQQHTPPSPTPTHTLVLYFVSSSLTDTNVCLILIGCSPSTPPPTRSCTNTFIIIIISHLNVINKSLSFVFS